MQEIASFLTVLVADICIAGCIGTLYAGGLRLWARGSMVDSEGNARLGARIGSVCCFTLCVAIILFALYLIIPIFH